MLKPKHGLLADDHSLYRKALGHLLKQQFSFSQILEAECFEEAVECLHRHSDIELAIFDLAMPGMNGPRSIGPLTTRFPATKFVIVSGSEANDDVLDAVAVGLSGYIEKTLPTCDIESAIRLILNGRIYVSRPMMKQIFDHPRDMHLMRSARSDQQSAGTTPPPVLTSRQIEVLDCIRAGMTNREIAAKLGISIQTVKMHVGALLTVYMLRNRVQLASL